MSRLRVFGIGLLLSAAGLLAAARATPGNAFVALSSAATPGDFEVDAYLSDPDQWPALAAGHPRGWAVAYRSANAPAGWTAPFVVRGGGSACADGVLNPRFAAAVNEMLPARAAAVLTLLDPPHPIACSPGKPNPHPFAREGWLFVHDGFIGIQPITLEAWRADWGPAWEAFKSAHPRDYDGNGDSTRGNAGEIYFLVFLFELSQGPGDASAALERTIGRLWSLPGAAGYQFNAIAQSADGLWAVRCANALADEYPIYYGRTSRSEHCVVDVAPNTGSWQVLDNMNVASFLPSGAVTIRAIDPVAWQDIEPQAAPAEPLRVWVAGNPAYRALRIGYDLPASASGHIELWSVDGRRVASWPVNPSGAVVWQPPRTLACGLYLVRIVSPVGEAHRRVLWVR